MLLRISQRLYTSSVVWSWAFNGLRLASGVLLIPLLLAYLSTPDLGMYYLLLSLNAVGPLMDFGFLNAINRAIGFAMGGAGELRPFGVSPIQENVSGPNYDLLGKLLSTTRWLYRLFALLLLLVLGLFGSLTVGYRIEETSSVPITWLAWGLTLFATAFELYSSWWNIFLRGMNEVLQSVRIMVIAYAIRLLVASALLVAGGGLLSMPIAAITTGIIVRFWSRRACLARMPSGIDDKVPRHESFRLLKILWPTSWRIGLQFFSSYLTTNANGLICTASLGLGANAVYGLSVHIMSAGAGMAAVWTAVKWPLVQQLRARGDLKTMRQVLRPRLWLQTATFWCLATGAVFVVPFLLEFFSTGKSVLPSHWFALLALLMFLEMQFSFWSGVIVTENRLPFLWPVVISNLVGLAMTVYFVKFANLGAGAFVLAPLVAGLLLNYWFWPIKAAQTMGTSLFRFLFGRSND
jgi:O-antigen/teichoic acid export membrane protein